MSGVDYDAIARRVLERHANALKDAASHLDEQIEEQEKELEKVRARRAQYQEEIDGIEKWLSFDVPDSP